MQIYPSIDIRKGRCVRLIQGKQEKETVYANYPVEVALRWKSVGATYLHVIDLDGAFTGNAGNTLTVREILHKVDIPVQLGGGIRTIKAIKNWLELGVDRIILGTTAVENPEIVRRAIDKWGPERIVVGIDAKNGLVAVNGWLSGTTYTSIDLAIAMKEAGVLKIIYTDIDSDGMMNGLNIDSTVNLAKASGLEVIASGGVASMDDLEQVSSFLKDGLNGVILGKSLYEGTIDLSEAIRKYQKDLQN